MSGSQSAYRPQSLKDRMIGGPEGFRKSLEQLGPTFIKIGQFLALRPDIISQEYSDELLHLLDDVEPCSWSDVRAIIQQDLGPPEQLFRIINPKPLAAGSIAQVHVASLNDGTRVAIKVLRPGIAERIQKDLRRARVFARALRVAHFELIASPDEVINELQEWFAQEIDFNNELRNMVRLRDLTSESRIQVIPRPYPELSTGRVLTAEYIQGVPMTDLLRLLDRNGERGIRRLGLPVSVDELAQNLLRTTLHQMFRYQFFHADVHPGNLIVVSTGAIGYVDFGLCAGLDENVRREQVRYLSAVYERNVPRMFQALLDVLNAREDADLEGFRSDFAAESQKWLSRVDAVAEDVRSPIAQWLINIMRAARRNGFEFPVQLLAMYRTLLTVETLAHRLAPGVSLRSVGSDFFVSLQIDDAIRSFSRESLSAEVPRLLALLRESPGQISQLLSDLADGNFTLRLHLTDSNRTRREKNRRAQLVAGAIISVGLSVLIAVRDLPSVGSVSLRPILLAVLVAVYISLWIQWRQMR